MIHRPFERIRLDEALKRENFEGWSEARIHAYKLKGAYFMKGISLMNV